MKFVTYFILLLSVIMGGYSRLKAMEAPTDHNEVEIVFENNQKGYFNRQILGISETLAQHHLPYLEPGQQLLLNDSNCTIYKEDFESVIYPLMQAVKQQDMQEIQDILGNCDLIKEFDKKHYKQVKKTIRFLGIKNRRINQYSNGKRTFAQAFILPKETVYKKQVINKEETKQLEQAETALPVIKLKKPGSTTLGALKMTPQALPYFSTVRKWMEEKDSDAKAICIFEDDISLENLKRINKIIPLFSQEKSELVPCIVKMLDSFNLKKKDIRSLKGAAFFLGCEQLVKACQKVLIKKIIYKNSKKHEIKLKNAGDVTIGILKMTPEALPYFPVLRDMFAVDEGAGVLSEQQISLEIVNFLNELLPLFFPRPLEELKKDIHQILKRWLNNDETIQLLNAANFLGCEPLMECCCTVLSENLLLLRNANNKEAIRQIIDSLNLDLRDLVCSQLGQRIIAIKTQCIIQKGLNTPNFSDITITNDGTYIAAYRPHEIHIINTKNGWSNIIRCGQTAVELLFLADGTLVSESPGVIKYWQIADRLPTKKFTKPKGSWYGQLSANDGAFIILKNGLLDFYYDNNNYKCKFSYGGRIFDISCDEKLIAFAGYKYVRIVRKEDDEYKECKLIPLEEGHGFPVPLFSPSGKWLAMFDSKFVEDIFYMVDMATEEIKYAIPVRTIPDAQFKFSSDDNFIVRFSTNVSGAPIEIYDVQTGERIYTLPNLCKLQHLCISPDSKLLVTVSENLIKPPLGGAKQEIVFTNLQTGNSLSEFFYQPQDDQPIDCIVFSPDSKSLIFGTDTVYKMDIRPNFNSLETEDIINELFKK